MSSLVTSHTGDCLDILPTLESQSIQSVVTSPPYWGLRDYGLPPIVWPAVSYAPMPGLPEMGFEEWRGCLGLEPSPEMYVAHLVHVFRLVREVLRDDGTCWHNMGDSYSASPKGNLNGQDKSGLTSTRTQENAPAGIDKRSIGLKPKDLIGIPWRAAFALQADGWWLRSDIIWAKPNPMPESVIDRPTRAHEYLFLLAKSARYYYDADAIREPHKAESIERDKLGWNAAFKGRHTMPGEKRPHSTDRNGFLNPGGRNKRTVWRVATQPYPEAHFATFPPALIEPCILAGTSAKGCCPECGAPWERVVEKVFHPQEDVSAERGVRGNGTQKPMDKSSGWQGVPRGSTESRIINWQPTCDCDVGNPIPCTVLDPFAGSGTTGRVAIKHNRRAILIELNPNYVALQRERMRIQMALPMEAP
jgi:DNA modification methylase